MRFPYKASSFNLALAGVSALSAAFWLFAMPAALLADLSGVFGIGGSLGGVTAPGAGVRFAVMVMGAGTVFLLVWLLLRALDGPRALPLLQPEDEEEWDWNVPRLRRADSHPDAPARRPISAAREFGEPVQTRVSAPVEPTTSDMDADVPLPSFLTGGQPSSLVGANSDPITEPVDDNAVAALDKTLELGPYRVEDEEAVVGEAAVQPDAEERETAAGADETGPASMSSAHDDGPYRDQAVQLPGNAVEFSNDELPPRKSLMARLALPQPRGDNVSILLRRLDAGLSSGDWPASAAATPERTDGMDARLRAAIEDLHRVVSRRG